MEGPKDRHLAWLDTLGATTLATFVEAPRETIIPTLARPTTGGDRALRNLEALAEAESLVIGEVIGEGGMGIVHRAQQVALGRTVAVKSLKPGTRNPGSHLDLLREAWITGAIEHPNVVPVHALELGSDGNASIVMKRIEGVEWSRLIADPDEVARRFGATDLLAWNLGILEHVLNAIRFAHRLGIVHRDLKPANVMVGDFGEVYLLDWGIAVALHDDGSGRFPLAKHANQLAGTPAYMAPEMLGRAESPPLSERTDVYLAGSVLYEIVAGEPPHRGTNHIAMISSVLASRPEMPIGTPPELARIIARAMHEDPEQRFESADALRLALKRFLEHRGSEVLCARAVARLGELRDATAAPSTTEAHDEVYRLFGACRYGFHDALAAWPENEVAARGLDEAILVVATYELDRGRAQAAVSLLRERTSASPLLERARAEAARQEQRIADLERLGRDHDQAIGRRTRLLLILLFGGIFTLVPLIVASVPQFREASHGKHIGWAGAMCALVTSVTWFARRSLLATAINRTLIFSTIFLFVTQGVMATGCMLADLPATSMYQWNLVLYASIVGILAIALDRYLLVASVAYLVGFLVVASNSNAALYAASAGNAVLTATGLWRWWPRARPAAS